MLKLHNLVVFIFFVTLGFSAQANDVVVMAAEFEQTGEETWSVKVTLHHKDTGWDHYTDAWRLVDADENVLGTRKLMHPHVDEQPFTRSLDEVRIPATVSKVYIEAHDKVHSWSEFRLEVDLARAVGGRLKVVWDEETP